MPVVPRSSRTKNRLKEHSKPGHSLVIKKKSHHLIIFNGPAVFFQCQCGWFGWLPEDEL